jgi:hypothetical protein
MKKIFIVSVFSVLGGTAVFSDANIKTGNIPLCGKTKGTVAVKMKTEGRCTAFGSLQTASTWEKSLFAVDPKTNKIVKRIAVSGNPYQIIAIGSELWVSATNSGSIEIVKP